MRKSVLFAASALILSVAQAEINPYVSLNLGVASVSDAEISNSGGAELETAAGPLFGMAVGVALDTVPVRIEAEYSYQENDIDSVKTLLGTVNLDGEATSQAGMLNVYYDFTNDTSPLTVSLMAGMGLANVDADLGMGDGADDDTVFAYQCGFGIGYPLSDNLMLDTKYTYFATDDPEFEALTTEIDVHRVTLGLRYSF